MSRPLRIQYEDAVYHVMNRGLGRQRIYLIDDDYGMFLEALKEVSWLYGIQILCYTFMPNHYHLLIRTPKANLSRAMRHLNGVYTQRFNRYHKTDGPLFRGRYKAILVQEDEYLTHLIRYIHLNPIQANLANDLTKYPHTSHQDYLKGKDGQIQDRGTFLYVKLGLSFFSNKLKSAIKQYKIFLKDGIDPRTKAFYKSRKQSPIFGDPDFIDRIKEQYLLSDLPISTEIPDKRKLAGFVVADKIIQESSRFFKTPKQVILQSGRGKANVPRLAAIHLVSELSGLKQSQIASLFKARSYRTIGTGCYRLRQLLKKNSTLKNQYGTLLRTCSQGRI